MKKRFNAIVIFAFFFFFKFKYRSFVYTVLPTYPANDVFCFANVKNEKCLKLEN